ncbi:PEP-CTERM sorting domain-containing protein [Colwellia sp. MB02u-10]|jgi:hypothetical protein|uniref:PEP-CTERM sorting domain-containing protein n=1 Tax=Colwellia sp. MB02u-10 TaxID=2759828 RepID=UPI0015F6C695|nr:PEP-CTERM sorting domain-containing protein [Colwellia sp. MB02u-10]MBA6342931.1 PEP-CTERM sorting domain-containing protein [Colwellia sp. MB02u-10]
MKYFKNFLLTACFVTTTMGVSLSANAALIPVGISEALVTQEIYVDMDFADANPFGIVGGGNQLIGSITYDALLADEFGDLDLGSTILDLSIGTLSLTLADGFDSGFGELIAGLDTANPFAGLDFFDESFDLFGPLSDFILTVSMGPLSGQFLELYDATNDFTLAFGEIRLGDASVQSVSEPSTLILMLLSVGLLVRRKIAIK